LTTAASNPKPWTINPTPDTLNPNPQTANPNPLNLFCKPQTTNPKLPTPNPNPYTRSNGGGIGGGIGGFTGEVGDFREELQPTSEWTNAHQKFMARALVNFNS